MYCRRYPKPGIESGARRRRGRGAGITLHAIAATQHYAEPQQGAAKESKAGRLGNGRNGRDKLRNGNVVKPSIVGEDSVGDSEV